MVFSEEEESNEQEFRTQQHKTQDYFEYEENYSFRNAKKMPRPFENDEIINLDGWFKKNVKLKKELQSIEPSVFN